MDFDSTLLRELLGAFGPSGREEAASALIEREIAGLADEIRRDALGNLIARQRGPGKRLMFSAHMDQIGFMVTDIDERGMLRFTQIGGHSPAVIYGQRVEFADGLQGVIGCEKIESAAELKGGKLYIDVGASSRDEAAGMVSVGDMCVCCAPYYERGDRVIARTLDDRVGCYILIQAMKAQRERTNDVYYVFSAQEEVGLRGAAAAGRQIRPELCLAVDVTHTGDVPNGNVMPARLGGGAAIKLKDGSIITHPAVKELLLGLCREKGIRSQFDILPGGGTDAGAVHTLGGGVPSGGVSIPTRWIHTPGEMVSKSDVNECVRLITAVAEHEFSEGEI